MGADLLICPHGPAESASTPEKVIGMKDVCILFPYYLDDYTTRHNFDILKKNNDDIDIYPLVWDCQFQPYLPNSLDFTNVEKRVLWQPEFRDKKYHWRNCDLCLYHFFLNGPEQYQRYVYLEADTICNIHVRDLYKASWGCDLVCKSPKRWVDWGRTWDHFRDLDSKTLEYYLSAFGPQCLSGATPLCGILVSLKCLREVVNNIQANPHAFRNMFCEMRIATAARLSHIEATVGQGLANSPQFDWFPTPFQALMTRRPGIYHAIKSIPLHWEQQMISWTFLVTCQGVLQAESDVH